MHPKIEVTRLNASYRNKSSNILTSRRPSNNFHLEPATRNVMASLWKSFFPLVGFIIASHFGDIAK
jgi:hypothetical protein